MLFFIRYQDKEYRVRVEARHGQTLVSFDHEPEQALDIVYYGNDCSLVQDDKIFAANVVGNKRDYTVWRPGGNLQFTLESEYRRIVGILRGQQLEDEHNVYAKMPGKIVKVLTKQGDTIEKGTSVMVMEAMKMENEIRSACTGSVSKIHVKEGQAVETGTLLMEMESAE